MIILRYNSKFIKVYTMCKQMSFFKIHEKGFLLLEATIAILLFTIASYITVQYSFHLKQQVQYTLDKISALSIANNTLETWKVRGKKSGITKRGKYVISVKETKSFKNELFSMVRVKVTWDTIEKKKQKIVLIAGFSS